jgi:hypothetical protein
MGERKCACVISVQNFGGKRSLGDLNYSNVLTDTIQLNINKQVAFFGQDSSG